MSIKNNFNLSNSPLTNSTIVLNQSQSDISYSQKKRVQLRVVDESITRISKKDTKKAIFKAILSSLLPILAILANILGLSSYFNLNNISVGFVIFFSIFAFILINHKNVIKLWLIFSIQSDQKSHFMANQFHEKDKDGNIISYQVTGQCLEPHCNGQIIVTLPPNQKINRLNHIGTCTEAGIQHTYEIDYNFSAKQVDFDWS
jgi:hypothetical protein